MYSVTNLLAVFLSLAVLTFAAPIGPEPLHRVALRRAPTIRDGEVCTISYLHLETSPTHADYLPAKDVHMAYGRYHEQAIRRSDRLSMLPQPLASKQD